MITHLVFVKQDTYHIHFVPSVCPPLKLLRIFLRMPMLAAYSGRLSLFTITYSRMGTSWPSCYLRCGWVLDTVILMLVLLCCMRLTNPEFFPSKLIYCIWLFTKTFSSQSGFPPGTSNPDSERFFFFPFVNILVLLILLGIAFPVHHVVLLIMVHLAERFRRDEQTWSVRKPYHIVEKRK